MLVTTLPIKPREKTILGMYIAPLLTEVISTNFKCSNILYFNLLNSYDNIDNLLSIYLNDINSKKINYTDIIVDKYCIDKFMKNIKSLVSLNLIQKKEKVRYLCDCKKVDIAEEGIRKQKIENNLYYFKDEKMYCKKCNSECKKCKENGLYLTLDKNLTNNIKIYPKFLRKEVIGYYNSLEGSDFLISKKRNTNYKIKVDGEEFYIDVDFLWMNFLNYYNDKKQVIISSNHQLFNIFILNCLNELYYKKDLTFIATPYLQPKDFNFEKYIEGRNDVLFKLCLLYSIKWKTKNSKFQPLMLERLSKLNDDQINFLYKNILENSDENIRYEDILFDKMNYQINMNKLNN